MPLGLSKHTMKETAAAAAAATTTTTTMQKKAFRIRKYCLSVVTITAVMKYQNQK